MGVLMNLPIKIKTTVGNIKIKKVKKIDPKDFDSDFVYGTYCFNKNLITVTKGLEHNIMCQTIIHEYLHSVEQSHGIYLLENNRTSYPDILASNILFLIRNNPTLIKFIMEGDIR